LSDTYEPSRDPKSAPTYRVLKAVVIGLGVLIVLALGALVVGIAKKMSGPAAAPVAAADLPVVAMLPPDTRILSMQASGDRLALLVHTGAGDEVDIVDLRSGKLVAQIKSPPASR